MKNIIALVSLLFAGIGFSQNYIPDTSFNHTGLLITPKKSSATFGNSLLYQPDGKLVVSGEMNIPHPVLSVNAFISYRLDSLGQKDAAYADTGRAITKFQPLSNDQALASLIQPDSKIILAGVTNGQFAMVRYLPNGRPDSTFGTNGLVITTMGNSAAVIGIKQLLNGSIFVAGTTDLDFSLAKYKVNGQIDSTFGNAGIVITDLNSQSYDMCGSFVIQPDGKIVACGYRWDNATGHDFVLVRYNANGSIDASFGSNGIAAVDLGTIYDYGGSVHLRSNGNLVITGNTNLGDGYYKFAAAELKPNGTLNTAFGSSGTVVATSNQKNYFLNKSVLLPNGSILMCGQEYNLSGGPTSAVMMRLNAGGQFDYSMNGSGYLTFGSPAYISQFRDILVQPDGKVVLCGVSDLAGDLRFQVLRYKPVPQVTTALTIEEQNLFRAFPNPANEKLVLQNCEKEFTLRVLNLQGDVIFTGRNCTELDVSEYAAGVYILECSPSPADGGGVKRVRFIKP